jgi:hypothetical protein
MQVYISLEVRMLGGKGEGRDLDNSNNEQLVPAIKEEPGTRSSHSADQRSNSGAVPSQGSFYAARRGRIGGISFASCQLGSITRAVLPPWMVPSRLERRMVALLPQQRQVPALLLTISQLAHKTAEESGSEVRK